MYIRAGKTSLACGVTVEITHVEDAEDQDLVGKIGLITHPFPGYMLGSSSKYIAGLRSVKDSQSLCNLTKGDRFKVIDLTTADNYSATWPDEQRVTDQLADAWMSGREPAGRSMLRCGTEIEITQSHNPNLVGQVGKVTMPFADLGPRDSLAGFWTKDGQPHNLQVGDLIKVLREAIVTS